MGRHFVRTREFSLHLYPRATGRIQTGRLFLDKLNEMPRIDPIQLLKCLGVLLSPEGGIKSDDEVQRLASLMTKFSKKLVSKCIYIQILKNTESELLGLFMESGGWKLTNMWITESIAAKNWPLVLELLELLLLCPVDMERLKSNNCPKVVKELSKYDSNPAIRILASKLVEQWLKTVKGELAPPILRSDIKKMIAGVPLPTSTIRPDNFIDNDNKVSNVIDSKLFPSDKLHVKEEKDNICIKQESEKECEALPILKITLKDGKQVISTVDESQNKRTEKASSSTKERSSKHKSKHRERNNGSTESSTSKSSSKHSSNSRSSSSSRHRNNHKSSSPSRNDKNKSKEKLKHSDKNSHSESSRKSSRDSSDKSKSSNSRDESKDVSSKSHKDSSRKDKEKDKDDKNGRNKDQSTKSNESPKAVPSIHKLGKIPKLSDVKKDKPSISIEVRKPEDPKPKTVKTFHSKFRKHGLEEEIKPPPSRAALLSKKTPSAPSVVALANRPSPVYDEPPEKKPKTIEHIEKPGSIKLIPAKPKPMLLQESDMFMDALNASATNKKEPKKRKRRTSGSKDGAPGDSSPPHTPTNNSTSPTNNSPSHENKLVPLRFYQDTLDTVEEKDKQGDKSENKLEKSNSVSPSLNSNEDSDEKMDVSESVTLTVNGIKGILCYHKKKGAKKNIKWKADLEEIQYFELDETERINVNRTFTDMKYQDRINEREAFEKARNLPNDDVMEEKTTWKPLIPVDSDGQIEVEYGKKSVERDIQARRQMGTLQPLYFIKSMIPDSPLEADIETHPYKEPGIIPLEDITGNQDNVSDFRNMPWPEPKGNAPLVMPANVNIPPMFQPPIAQFPPNFQAPPFGVPGFQGPNMIPTEWQNGMPPMMGPGMGPAAGPMMPGNMPPGVAPGLMMPPEALMMAPEMFNGPNPMFPPMPPDGFNMMENMNMPQNMFPPDFTMGQNIPGPDVTNGLGFRGAIRGRGSTGNWRGKGNWEGPPRGRGNSRGNRKTMCIYFQRRGSCRQGDNCSFLHPGVNGPFP